MSEEMSADTQAILLLCSRLGQTGKDGAKPLTPKQYGILAQWLRERAMRPAVLLSNEGRAQLKELQIEGLDRGNVESLLDRGVALGLATERWTSRGLWVMSRGDASYPARYKSYLSQAAPPLLFGAGNRDLLRLGGLAVVGSRDAPDDDVGYARRVGSTCAVQRIATISGGARGIDLATMAACFEAGGSAVGVLADGLARNAVSARYREGLISDRLVLVSPCDPDAHWFPFTAMDRNKFIYGLSDAALVVTSAAENGGTWSGATEALKYARIQVYVRNGSTIAEGNRKLLARGAKPFPPEPWDDFRSLFTPMPPQNTSSPSKRKASVHAARKHRPAKTEESVTAKPSARDAYLVILPDLLVTLTEPKTAKNIAEVFGLVLPQVKAWLKRACDEGRIRKFGRPVRYQAINESGLLFPDIEDDADGSPSDAPS